MQSMRYTTREPGGKDDLRFGIATVLLFLQQRISGMTVAFGTIDLVLGVLFLVAYLRICPTSGSFA